MQEQERIAYLLKKLNKKALSPAELEEVEAFFENTEKVDAFFTDSYAETPNVFKLKNNTIQQQIWKQIKQRIRKRKANSTNHKQQWLYYTAAATITLLIGLTFFKDNNNQQAFVKVENNNKSPKTIYLPDSSKVILATRTVIHYPVNFKEQRSLSLIGEAFFDVKRDTLHPFSISTGKLITEVLGTSFNIKVRDSLTKVSVNTGVVKVGTQQESYILKPDDVLAFNKQNLSFVKTTAKGDFFNLWTQNQVLFSSISLGELVKSFEILYNKEVIFEEEALKEKMLYSFFILRNELLEDIVERVNYINEVELKIYTNEIRVQKKQ